jgi:hypothetical protein
MPLTQAQRQQAAWLAIYTGVAEGLLAIAEQNNGALPPLTGTPLEVGWQTLWQLRADDDPDVIQWLQNLFGLSKRSWFYGLLLECTLPLPDIGYQPGDLLCIVRGTCTIEEWLDNFNAFTSNAKTTLHPEGGLVHAGFYAIYQSMLAFDAAGRNLGPAAPVLAGLLKPGGVRLTVAGHSLGAALSTYLAYDMANETGGDPARLAPLDVCLVASPNPGDATFGTGFQATVPRYKVVDWVRDLVPKVPPPPLYAPLPDGGGGAPLQDFTQLTPADVTWMPADPNDPTCNHHAACYARMLNPLNTVAVAQTALLNCGAGVPGQAAI